MPRQAFEREAQDGLVGAGGRQVQHDAGFQRDHPGGQLHQAQPQSVELCDPPSGALVSGSAVTTTARRRITAILNHGNYYGAQRRMGGLYVTQRRNGCLATVPGLVNRRAAEAGLWARGEFVASRHVAPAAPLTESQEAAKLGGYAAAAATAAPALQALAGVPVWIGVALVLAVAAVAVAVLLRRERAA